MSRIIINNLYKGRLPKGIAVEAKKLVRKILRLEIACLLASRPASRQGGLSGPASPLRSWRARQGDRGSGIGKEIGITFVGDKEIKSLNRKFRKKDRSTDVLAFEMNEERMLGDVVISVDSARRNAARFGESIRSELKRLVAHGVLHLSGYDHVKKADRVLMRDKEDYYLL